MKVQDNPDEGRYEVVDDGRIVGITVYKVRDGRYWFVHTEVDEALEGEGVGALLVRGALDAMRAKGVAVVPTCPFVAAWIDRHEDYQDLVDTETLSNWKEAVARRAARQREEARSAMPCEHVPTDLAAMPSAWPADGCAECLELGKRDWVHLRMCQACGHVGCCDNSPGKHGSAHARGGEHPLIRSFEPGEDWWYCYVHLVMFEVEGAPAAPSYR